MKISGAKSLKIPKWIEGPHRKEKQQKDPRQDPADRVSVKQKSTLLLVTTLESGWAFKKNYPNNGSKCIRTKKELIQHLQM